LLYYDLHHEDDECCWLDSSTAFRPSQCYSGGQNSLFRVLNLRIHDFSGIGPSILTGELQNLYSSPDIFSISKSRRLMLYFSILLHCMDLTLEYLAPSKCSVLHCSFIGQYFTKRFGLTCHFQVHRLWSRILLHCNAGIFSFLLL
jgi:hypothetical protein